MVRVSRWGDYVSIDDSKDSGQQSEFILLQKLMGKKKNAYEISTDNFSPAVLGFVGCVV